MKKLLIGASLAALVAVPALALQAQDKPGGRWNEPQTRAQVEAQVKERFAAIDANKDGSVTKAEFDAHREAKKAEWQAKRAERQAERFASLDTDKNGQLSKAEYTAPRERMGKEGGSRAEGDRGHRRGHHGMHRGGWRGMGGGDWFAKSDANKDGRLTLAEASAWPLQMFDKADANKDGTVTPEERRAVWQAMRAEKRGS